MNTSRKSARRKRISRNSPSGSRSRWIICPATRTGSANLPRGIRGLFHRLGALRLGLVGIDNPAKLSEWNNRDAFEVWSAYFERLTLAAKSSLFEIIGHADLPKKFGHRPTRNGTPLYESFWPPPRIRLRH